MLKITIFDFNLKQELKYLSLLWHIYIIKIEHDKSACLISINVNYIHFKHL